VESGVDVALGTETPLEVSCVEMYGSHPAAALEPPLCLAFVGDEGVDAGAQVSAETRATDREAGK
jgi:hypothetical protein